jgi:hypothetical protein
MKKKNFSYYGNYRAPKTTQEKRVYDEHKEYVRGKRSKRMLPGTWDDIRTSSWDLRKSWKIKRKKQYRVGNRGQEHKVRIESHRREWEIEEYLEIHDIPFRRQNIYRCYNYSYIDHWT